MPLLLTQPDFPFGIPHCLRSASPARPLEIREQIYSVCEFLEKFVAHCFPEPFPPNICLRSNSNIVRSRAIDGGWSNPNGVYLGYQQQKPFHFVAFCCLVLRLFYDRICGAGHHWGTLFGTDQSTLNRFRVRSLLILCPILFPVLTKRLSIFKKEIVAYWSWVVVRGLNYLIIVYKRPSLHANSWILVRAYDRLSPEFTNKSDVCQDSPISSVFFHFCPWYLFHGILIVELGI